MCLGKTESEADLERKDWKCGERAFISTIRKSNLNTVLPFKSSKNELFLSILFSHCNIVCWNPLIRCPKILYKNGCNWLEPDYNYLETGAIPSDHSKD